MPQVQEGKSLWHFVQLSVHLQAIAGEYLRETSTKPLGMLTHLLALVNLASVGQQVLAVAFWLLLIGLLSVRLSSSDWPILSTSLCCSLLMSPSLFSETFLPSSSSDLVGDLVHRKRDSLTGTHTHRNKCHPLCHNTFRFFFLFYEEEISGWILILSDSFNFILEYSSIFFFLVFFVTAISFCNFL